MPDVHGPQDESADQSRRSFALIKDFARVTHGFCSPLRPRRRDPMQKKKIEFVVPSVF
jgi:hypothetical protein